MLMSLLSIPMIGVDGVVIFKISWVKLSIICSCFRQHIFWTVFLELNLSLVIRGRLKCYLPMTSDRLIGAQRLLTGQRVIRPCSTDKPKWIEICFIGAFGKSLEPLSLWLLRGLRYLLTFWPIYENNSRNEKTLARWSKTLELYILISSCGISKPK